MPDNINVPVIVDSIEEKIENRIHYIRGQQVMTDSDLHCFIVWKRKD